MSKNNQYSISYAITVCNEVEQLHNLVTQLKTSVIKPDDEIVIQVDSSHADCDKTVQAINSWNLDATVIQFPLNKDFSSFKNNLKMNCKKKYIFQLDADEELGVFLWDIKELLSSNPHVELFWLSRINTVSDITLEYIKQQNWKVDTKNTYNGQPIINWPDYQSRLFKNLKRIKWVNKVHEKIEGHKNFSLISDGDYDNINANRKYSIIHQKSFERQKKQNEFYKTI